MGHIYYRIARSDGLTIRSTAPVWSAVVDTMSVVCQFEKSRHFGYVCPHGVTKHMLFTHEHKQHCEKCCKEKQELEEFSSGKRGTDGSQRQ